LTWRNSEAPQQRRFTWRRVALGARKRGDSGSHTASAATISSGTMPPTTKMLCHPKSGSKHPGELAADKAAERRAGKADHNEQRAAPLRRVAQLGGREYYYVKNGVGSVLIVVVRGSTDIDRVCWRGRR
jgi:hypothetical protein